MKNKEEIKEWLLRNAVDEDGDLNLSGLDFSDFAGDVYISEMKVKGDLYQRDQEVKGDLIQKYQKVEGSLYQDKIINGKTKEQAFREVEKIYENN